MNISARVISSTNEKMTAEFLLSDTLGLPPAQSRHPRMVQILAGSGVFQVGNEVYQYDLSTEGQSVFYIPTNTPHLIAPLTTTRVRATQYYGSVPRE